MGKAFIITGIKRIGKEIALHLLKRGHSVSVVYRGSESQAKEIKEEGGDRVLDIKADLTEESSYKEIVNQTFGKFGRIDGFIHLASPYSPIEIGHVNPQSLNSYMKPITYAFTMISIEAYEYMLKNESTVKGRIVAFGEWAVTSTPYRHYAPYFIAKGALHSAVKVLAKEFAPHVLVNCIAPGPVLIPEGMEREKWEGILGRTPLRKAVSMRDILALTDFLLETESMTGEVIHLDGGRHIAGSGI